MSDKPKRIAVTERRTQAVYNAVHDGMTDARIEVSRLLTNAGVGKIGDEVDAILSRIGHRAGMDAIAAVSKKL